MGLTKDENCQCGELAVHTIQVLSVSINERYRLVGLSVLCCDVLGQRPFSGGIL